MTYRGFTQPSTLALPIVEYKGKTGLVGKYYFWGFAQTKFGARVRLQHINHDNIFLGYPERVLSPLPGDSSKPPTKPLPQPRLRHQVCRYCETEFIPAADHTGYINVCLSCQLTADDLPPWDERLPNRFSRSLSGIGPVQASRNQKRNFTVLTPTLVTTNAPDKSDIGPRFFPSSRSDTSSCHSRALSSNSCLLPALLTPSSS